MELLSLKTALNGMDKKRRHVSLSLTEIRSNDEDLLLEIQNTKIIINNVPNYFSRFVVIDEVTDVIVQKSLQEKEVLKSHKHITYSCREHVVPFQEYFHQNINNVSVSLFLSAYRQILRSLRLLKKSCQLDFFGFWNENSIMYDPENEKPLLHGLQSASMDNISFKTLERNKAIPELQIYLYLIENNLETLSLSDLSLKLTNLEDKGFAKAFVNKKREHILNTILTWSSTWDLYSLNFLIQSVPCCPPFLSNICKQYLQDEPNKRTDLDSFIWLVDREIILFYSASSS